MAIPIISVIGWHNSGKTTFIVGLIAELRRRGLRVATIKHTRAHFDVDKPGTDTWRLAQAGADVVAISGQGKMALIEQLADDEELTLAEIVRRLPVDIDLVITEGYKALPIPKIEVMRADTREGRITSPGEPLALVIDESGDAPDRVPRFSPADVVGVADLLVAKGFIELTTE